MRSTVKGEGYDAQSASLAPRGSGAPVQAYGGAAGGGRDAGLAREGATAKPPVLRRAIQRTAKADGPVQHMDGGNANSPMAQGSVPTLAVQFEGGPGAGGPPPPPLPAAAAQTGLAWAKPKASQSVGTGLVSGTGNRGRHREGRADRGTQTLLSAQ